MVSFIQKKDEATRFSAKSPSISLSLGSWRPSLNLIAAFIDVERK